jgi:transposase-like protein
LEQILLHNISDFLKMKWALEHNSDSPLHLNGYHHHLQWLIAKFNQLTATALCSECDQPATILPVMGSHHEGYHFVPRPLCTTCHGKTQWRQTTTVRLSPWALENFRTKVDKKRAWEAIKAALGVPKKTNGQELFELLSNIKNQSPA